MSQVNFTVPEAELMNPGHLGCQGCGAALGMRYVLKGLDEKTVFVIPACCWTIVAGPLPRSALKVPILHTAFETAAVTAAGVRASLDMQGDTETTVVAWAGDGGTFDIGLQSLSGAAERNEDILYICYDNEAYMNTGIQRSSATPWGAWTSTTPGSNRTCKKDIMQILAAHRIPYAATASIAYPEDVIRKVRKAKNMRGTRFIHLLSPCPPGWRIPSELTVKLARLAVQSHVFPLFEVEDGLHYVLETPAESVPVSEYLELQGRFRSLEAPDVEQIQEHVNARWQWLQQLAGKAAAPRPGSESG